MHEVAASRGFPVDHFSGEEDARELFQHQGVIDFAPADAAGGGNRFVERARAGEREDAVFDFAVNSGVSRASKYFQAVVGVSQDGQIGVKTIAAIKDAKSTINALCDRRMSFLRNLGTFMAFGRGWTRRVQGVRAKALEMAS